MESRWRHRWQMWLPRLAMAFKSAAAASLAWLIVLPFGAGGPDYGYYAPLGAVIAVSATVARSSRRSIQTVAAILIGSALTAAVAWILPGPGVIVLTIVIAVGVLLSAVPWLGAAGQWVPLASLFVLVVDQEARVDYIASYAGLTALGAFVGIAMNAAFPPLPVRSLRRALDDLRTTTADQLERLSGRLRTDPGDEESAPPEVALDPRRQHARQLVTELNDARRGNWRARHWTGDTDRQREYAAELQRLSLLVEDLPLVVDARQCEDHSRRALGPALRPLVADALGDCAELLRCAESLHADPTLLDTAERSVAQLEERTLGMRDEAGDLFIAGMVVTVLRDIVRAARAHLDGASVRSSDQ
ncbi:hypothetical protein JL108_12470 [Aeromicrobium sp. YIM 150415]|uniref:FUSC family protein n=1 Tax=Aeromicrobium sp. YIM 150415 TaxID=2803912 RepID=UPI001966A628|nr:FUSC family protein [Aeromicrobium sp. YIM 150415]MBM9464267.1 hypothetical protein [Aeromicrobium sp. YIM 150415]